MPIRPHLRHYYRTAEWQAARAAVLQRATHKRVVHETPGRDSPSAAGPATATTRIIAEEWRCERCGATHGHPHPRTASIVVLTVAHLDQDPRNNDLANLLALCQRCHLAHDHTPAARARRVHLYAELAGQGRLFDDD